jgi:CheY-like chemotaxis protein
MQPVDFPDVRNRIILLVDDNEDALEVLGTFLSSCGASILQARTAVDALAYIDTQPHIDVMVTDLSMPDMDGVELVRRLRRHPLRSAMPAIALTGFPESYKDTAGFTAFMLKPANLDDLCKTITTVIEQCA